MRQRREGTFKRALLHSQKVLDQMQENARRQADVIVAEAQAKADKLLQHAQNRMAQLQEAIADLKRQRVQVEAEITFVIESHRRLLEAGAGGRALVALRRDCPALRATPAVMITMSEPAVSS